MDSLIYKSMSQKARVLSEGWVKDNLYCPICGFLKLEKQDNNTPMSDFLCSSCNEEFEIKSSKSGFGKSILGGSYSKAIERVENSMIPNFIFLKYNYVGNNIVVEELFLIPKHLFTQNIFKKRKPLAARPTYIMCTIALNLIPESGVISLIKDYKRADKDTVLSMVRNINKISDINVKDQNRGWVSAILRIVDKLNKEFSIYDVYKEKDRLSKEFPNNNNIEAKIRQQLQILRDLGFILFLGGGKYKKI